MNLEVGPVASASARIWIDWAHDVLNDLRIHPTSTVCPLADPRVVDDLDDYLNCWSQATRDGEGSFRWEADLDPDEVEYLANALCSLDALLSADLGRGDRARQPARGHVFHLVMVRALLDALARESPARGAFAEHLRGSWLSAAQVD